MEQVRPRLVAFAGEMLGGVRSDRLAIVHSEVLGRRCVG
jgi:hypothetical protein